MRKLLQATAILCSLVCWLPQSLSAGAPVVKDSAAPAAAVASSRSAEVVVLPGEPGFSTWRDPAQVKATCGGVECLPKGCDTSAGGCFCIWGLSGNCGASGCKLGCIPST